MLDAGSRRGRQFEPVALRNDIDLPPRQRPVQQGGYASTGNPQRFPYVRTVPFGISATSQPVTRGREVSSTSSASPGTRARRNEASINAVEGMKFDDGIIGQASGAVMVAPPPLRV